MARLRATTEQKTSRAFSRWVAGWIMELNESQEVIAGILGISQPAVSAKMRGKSVWTLDDMALICEHFGRSYTVGADD